MNKFAATFFAAAMLVSLTACGTRGPLTLPPGPAPEPLLGHPQPAKPASQIAPVTDLSTDQKARPQ